MQGGRRRSGRRARAPWRCDAARRARPSRSCRRLFADGCARRRPARRGATRSGVAVVRRAARFQAAPVSSRASRLELQITSRPPAAVLARCRISPAGTRARRHRGEGQRPRRRRHGAGGGGLLPPRRQGGRALGGGLTSSRITPGAGAHELVALPADPRRAALVPPAASRCGKPKRLHDCRKPLANRAG